MSVRIVGSLPFLITASAIKPRSCRLMRIRSFKPVLEHIKDQLLPDYSFHIAAVSDTRERMKLMVPEVDGVAHLQGASLDPAYFDKPWVRQRLKGYGSCLTFTFAGGRDRDFRPSQFATPYVVNIDVEGVEAKVLRGMQQTIAACHPVFLIENSDWHAVYGLLGGALVSLLFYMLVAMRSGI